jgi:hypothetical protein
MLLCGKPSRALSVLDNMQALGMRFNVYSYVILMRAHFMKKDWKVR